MKTIWCTLLLICFAIQSSSQVDAQLQEKYSNFRERFRKEFVVIGDQQGRSIPVERRVQLQYADFACSIAGLEDKTAVFWNDNGLMDIGLYIAILSTEYHLKALSGEDVWPTLNELYYAIQAVNRLDESSHDYLEVNVTLSPPGHLLRDDVDSSILLTWADYDESQMMFSKAWRSYDHPYDNAKCFVTRKDPKNFMSKDEIIGLLNGFMYTIKFVPDVFVKPTTNDAGFNIVTEVRAITHRIMMYLTTLHEYNTACPEPNGPNYKYNMKNWVILAPNGTPPYQTNRDRNHGTEFLAVMSWPICKTAEYITGNVYDYKQDHYSYEECYDPEETPSLEHKRRGRKWVYDFLVDAYRDKDQHPHTPLGAIKQWLAEMTENARINANMILLTGMTGAMDAQTFWSIANNYKLEKYILGENSLQGYTLHSSRKDFFKTKLEDSPVCENIGRMTSGDYNTDSWGRWLVGNNQDHKGETYSMDFMLAYNLYRIHFEKPSLTPTPANLYNTTPCDCHTRANVNNNSALTLSSGTTKTLALNLPVLDGYEAIGIKLYNYITNDVTVNSGSTLKLHDRVVHCTKTGEANSRVVVYGTMEVGSSTKRGIYEVRTTSNDENTLEVRGTLKVYDNSEVIIHANSYLTANASPTIELLGTNAVLRIAGTLQLGTGAQLKIVGPGKVIFEAGMAFAAETGSSVEIGDLNYRTKLEVVPNYEMIFPATMTYFKTVNMDAKLGQNVLLDIRTKADFFNSNFTSMQVHYRWNKIVLSGNHAHNIRFTEFDWGTTGLNIVLSNSSQKPTLQNCKFRYASTNGLKVVGGGFQLSNCQFVDGEHGVIIDGATSKVEIVGTSFDDHPTAAIHATIFNNQILSVKNTQISNGADPYDYNSGLPMTTGIYVQEGNAEVVNLTVTDTKYPFSIDKGFARVACSQFTNGYCAFEVLSSEATLNIGQEARIGITDFHTGIYSSGGGVLLNNGLNALDDVSDHSIQGRIYPNCFQELNLPYWQNQYIPGVHEFNRWIVSGNLLKTPLDYPMTSDGTPNGALTGVSDPPILETFQHTVVLDPFTSLCMVEEIDENTRPLYIHQENYGFTYQSCSAIATPWWAELYPRLHPDDGPSNVIINTPYYPNVELVAAINDAMGDVTVTTEDPLFDIRALNKMREILSATYTGTDEVRDELLGYVCAAMSQALANAYALEVLPKDFLEPELSPEAEFLVDYYDSLMIEYSADPAVVAQYALEKGQVYRVCGAYADALEIFNSPEAVDARNLEYWICLTENELDLVTEEISSEVFVENVASCNLLYQARRMKPQLQDRVKKPKTNTSSKLYVYPNPSEGNVTVALSTDALITSVRVFTTLGMKVKDVQVTDFVREVHLNLTGLESGTYYVEAFDNLNDRHIARLVVLK